MKFRIFRKRTANKQTQLCVKLKDSKKEYDIHKQYNVIVKSSLFQILAGILARHCGGSTSSTMILRTLFQPVNASERR